jgi:hypothetical protein
MSDHGSSTGLPIEARDTKGYPIRRPLNLARLMLSRHDYWEKWFIHR